MTKCIMRVVACVRKSTFQSGSVALVAFGIASVAAPVAFGLIHGKLPVYGQILHANGPLPSYEVVTIKPFQPGQTLAFDNRPDVTTTVGPIKQLIGLAFNLPPFSMEQIVGAPEWTSSERYVVQGKIDESMYAQLRTLSRPQEMRQRQLLVQSLLADRMKLKVHFETRELPMYALVIDKGGSKLRPSKEMPESGDSVLPPPMAPGAAPSLAGLRKGFYSLPEGATSEMEAKGLTLDELAQSLQVQQDAGGRLIVNQTGLSGFYDCSMKWARQFPVTATSDRTTAPESDEPPFFTAIREQLGLRLVPTKGPAEVIVIDHIEKPSEKEN